MATPKREAISELLNNQPNGVRIGCGRYRQPDPDNVPFHHLSRLQQIEEIEKMISTGIDVRELQCELYLVCHKPTREVWFSFGFPPFCEPSDIELPSDSDEFSTDDDE